MAKRAPRWTLGWAEGVWGAVILVALFTPLTEVVGYEFAFVLNALVVALGPWVWRRRERGSSSVWEAFRARCVALLPHLGVSVVLGYLNALRVRNCAPWDGLFYVLVLAVGAVPVMAAWSLLAERLAAGSRHPRRNALLWTYGAVVVSIAASAWWLATQPPLIVYDAFLGFFTASLYDEALASPWSHLPFRAMTLAAAFFWVSLLNWEQRGRSFDALWAAFFAVLVFTAPFYKAPANISRSRAYTVELLGGYLRTEHFEIYYDARGMRREDVVQLAADHEARYDELAQFWGIEPPLPLVSFIYGSAQRRADAMGSRTTMIARIWLGEMHLVWGGPGDGLLAHEMSHLFLRDAGSGPLRLSTRYGVFPLMGLVEGSASAAAWESDVLTEHGWAAAIMRLGLIESPAKVLGATGFWSASSGVVYTLWGSFARWLIDERGGPAPFLRAYRGGDFEAAYEVPLQTLLTDWERDLRAISLDEALMAEASLRFGRASILQRVCGRALATWEADAQDAIARRDWDEAQTCLKRLVRAASEDAPLRYRVAMAWEWMDRDAEAATILTTIAGDEAAGLALRQNARLRLVDLAWRSGDLDAARRWLHEMADEPMNATVYRNHWVRTEILANASQWPMSEAVARRYLAAAWRYRDGDLRSDLVAAALTEEAAPVIWLAYVASARSPDQEVVERLYTMLDAFELPDELAHRRALWWGRWLLLRGDRAGCSVLETLAQGDENWADGLAASARTLYHRCADAGLYLDAARRAVE